MARRARPDNQEALPFLCPDSKGRHSARYRGRVDADVQHARGGPVVIAALGRPPRPHSRTSGPTSCTRCSTSIWRGRVVLSPAQDQAYGRFTQRLLDLQLNDPLARFLFRGGLGQR